MSSDDVADLLGDLKEKEKRLILSLVEENQKIDLIELLTYAKNSAGGRMTTEYIAFSKNLKAKEALDKLADLALDGNNLLYICGGF